MLASPNSHGEIPPEQQSNELFIWVLEDYDTEEWVLKDTVSFLKLVGKMTGQTINGFKVVAIHPDHSLVFLIQHFNQDLLSYNMDKKCLVSALAITPSLHMFHFKRVVNI